MTITELINEAKITNDEELINQIIKHYEPYFCNNVEKTYGKGFEEKAKETLPRLVNYYFENNMKDDLNSFLRKRAFTIFNEKHENFNKMINSDNKEKLKEHYIDKVYNMIKKKYQKLILSDEEIQKLSEVIVEPIYNNYIKSTKKSNTSNYFNSMINRKLKIYDEEKLYLIYIQKIALTEKITNYFFNKYKYLLKEFKLESEETFKELVEEVLFSSLSLHFNFEARIRNKINQQNVIEKMKYDFEMKKLKEGKEADIDLIKKHCLYIKELVFNKFKNKVMVSEEVLNEEIDLKFENHFNAGIHYIKKNPNCYLAQYINTRLSESIKRKKRFFKPVYVDFEKQVLEEIKKIKEGKKGDIELIKRYYISIKNMFFNKIKGNNETLKKKIDLIYEDCLNDAIAHVKSNPNDSLTEFLNYRLEYCIKTKREPFEIEKSWISVEERKNNIKENVRFVNKYAVKYAGTCPREVLFENLISKYNSLTKEYYTKARKTSFSTFVKIGLREEAKRVVANYVDDSSEDLKKEVGISYKKTPNNN